ncbi:MAG: MerR family transcriptional regulator [Coriobacteriales bacterium]|jgi:DNA-binding transcriptional MerR regulator|nr:MerR family transcriptional regulator [Coriobacteriales bacterium]
MKNGLFSISELAHYTMTSRATLLFYDKIGLVKPVARAENNYRYYSHDQISIISMVHTFQSLGMPLDEIKDLLECRTPELFSEKFSGLAAGLEHEIDQLQRSLNLLNTLHSMIEEVSDIDETQIIYHYQKAQSVLMGPKNDYSNGRTNYDALVSFYDHCRTVDPNMNLNWAAWGYFPAGRIKQHDWFWPERYYFYRPGSPDVKPAGWYVTGYTHGDYGQTDELYIRLLNFIEKQGLEIIGSAYEEYPLNEVAIVEPQNYLIRISIQVNKKA